MKFECDSCGANYMIADEKVGKRGVKVKCKRCSHVIIVRPEKDEAAPEPSAPSTEGAGQDAPGLDAPTVGVFAQGDHSGAGVAGPGGDLDLETKVGGLPDFRDGSQESETDGHDVALGSLLGDDDDDDASQPPSHGAAANAGAAGLGEDAWGAKSTGEDGEAWSTGGAGALSDDDGDGGQDDDVPSPPGSFDAGTLDAGTLDAGGFDVDVPAPPPMDLPLSGLAGSGLGSDEKTAIGGVPGWQMSGEQNDTQVGAGADLSPASPLAAAAVSAGPSLGDPSLSDPSLGDPSLSDPSLSDPSLGDPSLSDPSGADDEVPAPPGDFERSVASGMDGDLGGASDEAGMPPADGGGGDAFDEQLAGAFSNMFGDSPGGDDVPAPPAFGGGDDDLEQYRGPTQVLDISQMQHLRAQATPSGRSGDGPPFGRSSEVHPGLDATFGSLDRSLDTQQGDALAPWGSGDATQMASGDEDEGGWHVAVDDEDVGPLELHEISEHIQSGRVDRDSLVWRSGMDDWEPAGDIPSIARLFESLPMPRIGSLDVGTARGGGGVPPPTSDDPFGNVPDGPDPNWQPHGLTDVYQAANLAEAAGLVSGAPNLGRAPVDDNADDGEWRPGAAGALAALVQDEIARIDDEPAELPSLGGGLGGGLGAADDFAGVGMLADGAGAGAEVGGLGSAPSSAALATGGLASGGLGAAGLSSPHLSGPGLPMNGGYGSPALSSPLMAQVPMVDSYPPQPAMSGFAPVAQPAARSPAVYVGATVGAIFLLVIAAALVKLAFFGGPSPTNPNNMVAANAAEGQGGAQPASSATSASGGGAGDGTRLASADSPAGGPPAEDDGTAEAAPGGDTAPPASTNSASNSADDKDDKARNAEPSAAGKGNEKLAKADKKSEPPKETRVASRNKEPATKRSPPKRKDPPKRAQKRETRKEPDPPPKRASRASRDRSSKSSRKGCDPILDIDCDEKKPTRKRSSDAKEKLSKSDILVVVKNEISGVRACFNKNGVDDTVKMEWKILKSGRTSGVRVLTSKYAGTPMGRCMTNEIKRWKFPAYSGAPPPPITFPFKK